MPLVREIRRQFLCRFYKMDIAPGAQISLSARLDKSYPMGVHIGPETSVNFEATILTHDFINGKSGHVYIGRRCFIGARSIIYPGVSIGDHCIISAASVVMKDVPPNSIAAGNPARVIERGILTGVGGRLIRDPVPESADPLQTDTPVPAMASTAPALSA